MSRRSLAVLAAISMVFSVFALTPAGAAPLDPTDLQAADAVVASENPFKGLSAGTFVVSLDDPAVALYEGGIGNLRATSTRGEAQLDVTAAAATAYRSHLEGQHNKLIDRLNRDLGRTVSVEYQYFNAFNGIAVHLSPAEAARVLKMPGVSSVQADTMHHIDTDAGPGWIGAPSIWDGSATGVGTRGEGIVVGILDTGINPENPSFADVGGDGYDHTNPFGAGNYVGVCNPAEADYQPGFVCNDKLIGAWNMTVLAGPTDDDGHGSHTASTSAGNVVDATVVAPTKTIDKGLSGVAPHANIIAYDVCTPSGCSGAAIIGGIDQAIADGVDVINYSIGSDTPTDPWSQDSQLGFLAAREAGIFVAHSAGNEGPEAATSGSPNAPWMTHVAATTHTRKFTNSAQDFTGGDSALADIEGVGFAGGYGPAPIVYAGDYPSALTAAPELCGVGSLGDEVSPWPAGTFTNEIVVCDRGTFGRVEKGTNALAAGAAGMILADNGAGLVGDPHDLPAVHISQSDGQLLKDWLAAGSDHMGTIGGAVESISDANADILAGFSSRGPNSGVDMVIPSISAPGVDIIAAHGTGGDIIWDFLSGTSMASPHIAGSAALLMALNPTWTPAEVQSAMMLTASQTVLIEDGVTPGTPFDRGNGRIDLHAAANSGLVMSETIDNYVDANPATGGDVGAINLASMANSACVLSCSWTRTVTATTTAAWTASGIGHDGLVVAVSPENFSLVEGETQEITITADVTDVAAGGHVFGYLVLEAAGGSAGDGVPAATMPIAVQATTGDIPAGVHIWTRRDAGSWQVDDLTALEITDLTVEVDGLTIGEQDNAAIPGDSNNGDVFDDVTDGTYLKLVDVPAGATNIISEVLASESPDLDMFLGYDLNNDGIPTPNELGCVSASGTALESCEFQNPPAGQWWVLIQNWSPSAPDAVDAFTLSTAVLDGTDEGNMWIDGPGAVGQLDPFSVRVFWDEPAMESGDRLYGSFSLGTDAGNAGNLGTVAVVIERHPDDVTKTASTDMAMAGDTVTYEITVEPNVTHEDLAYTITDTIPEGMTYVDGSATSGATVTDGVLSWAGTMPSPALAEGSYVATTNAADASCDTPFGGGYVNLEDFGILADPGVVGDTVAFTAFASGDPVAFYGDSFAGVGFTDDGFAIFDAATHYAGAPWVPQTLPDPTAPNNVAASFWQDFEIFYDAATNTGVSLATSGAPGGLVVIEFDGVQLFGGSELIMDMEIFVTRAVDNAPGAYEIVYAYDNVAASVPGTIGVENADGSGAATVDSGAAADGSVVCFDWTGPSLDAVVISYDVTVDDFSSPSTVTNEVVSDTDNPGSQPTTTSVDVDLVDAPAAALGASVAQLSDWVNNPPADLSAVDLEHVTAAHGFLVSAMTADRWVNDTTLDATNGRAVFTDLRRAVRELQKMSKGTSIYVAKNGIKRDLVGISGHIAHMAHDAAVAAGADQADLDRAAFKMAKADKRESKRMWRKSVKSSKQAWVASIQHLLGA
ncbi:MAG: S8 family serine peptidase [bacterium]|nr:S8 family serine peptidase [bacterium]